MNNDYVNNYIELMTATMQDAILRNISLQANAKITEDLLQSKNKEVDELKEIVNSKDNRENQSILDLQQEVNNLRNQNNSLKSLENEYNNVKSQAQHVDTFRNELQKARDELNVQKQDYEKRIEELNKQIEYLQLTPAKRKKIDETKVKPAVEQSTISTIETIIEDGGSF